MKFLQRILNIFGYSEDNSINLFESNKTEIAHIGFTSKCNLRCVFCNASQPKYKGIDLDEGLLYDITESLKERDLKILNVNGHGETTIYKNWSFYCNRLLNYNLPLHIITNFAKNLSEEEVETLSKFKSIEISCDSADPDLFARLRRGAKLESIKKNIKKIHSICSKTGRKYPNISFSCVVTNKNVLGLLEYVKFGEALKVNHFSFCNLTKYPDVPDALNVNHVTEMPVEFVKKAYKSINETIDFLKKSTIHFNFQQGLLDSIKEKLATHESNPHYHKNETGVNPSFIRFSSSKEEGQTRDCLDPWKFVQIDPNKDVVPCCWHPRVGTLDSGKSLLEILNDVSIKKLRKEILTGNLNNYCSDCPSKGLTSVKNLKKKVEDYIRSSNNKYENKKNLIKAPLKMNLNLSWDTGWYHPESDEKQNNQHWRNWRWTSKKAVCTIENPKKESILVVWGAINKDRNKNQQIRIKLNEKILSEFIPVTSKFLKEFIVPQETLGLKDRIKIYFETNETFIPAELNPQLNDKRELGMQIFQLYFYSLN